MSGLLLLVANVASMLLPQTRCFGTRRALYRLAGVDVASTAKINGTVRIYYPNVRIGKDTWVGAGTLIIPTAGAPVVVGASCDVGPGVMFVTGSHDAGGPERRAGRGYSLPILIGDGTWIGARATFLAGASVGRGCVVAAAAVVRGEFPDDVMVAGVPARIVKEFH